jgi:biotin carboxylase
MARLLLLLPTSGYRNDDFLAAAARLGVQVIAAQDQCGPLTEFWGGDKLLALSFSDPAGAASVVRTRLGRQLPDAVLGVDDAGVEAAAHIAAALGLPANAADAVAALRDKGQFRRLQEQAGLPRPPHRLVKAGEDVATAAGATGFPMVVKPLRLSGSRGVIRVDQKSSLAAAIARVRAILRRAEIPAQQRDLLLEEYLPGREVAVDGLIGPRGLRTLAVFDKPDPLEGPYFAETIYVTPARISPDVQTEFVHQVWRACTAAGLRHGPIHAEARIHDGQVTLLEIAPRTIGGLCGRVLRRSLGMSLEELVIRDALGLPVEADRTDPRPSGVMMIPVPRAGIFKGVAGVDAARAVDGIDDVVITARAGEVVSPLPEESSYIGFLFARGDAADAVEHALRAAYDCLHIEMQNLLGAQSG